MKYLIWSLFFSPGRINHFIEKNKVHITTTATDPIIIKSQLLCGPAPWLMPCKSLGCCFSQTGQALPRMLDNKVNDKPRIFFIKRILIKIYCAGANFIKSIIFFISSAVTGLPLLPQLLRS